MNLLNKYSVSTESVNPFITASLEEINVAIEEMEEILEDSEEQQEEIHEADQELDRLETARQSVELQDQVVQSIVSDREDGKLTEQEQVLAQVNRRSIVASLGIDPESEEGKEYVEEVTDEPVSTEAMDNKNSFINKLVEGAKEALRLLVQKVGNFFGSIVSFLAKLGTGAKAKYTKLLKALENVTPEKESNFKSNQVEIASKIDSVSKKTALSFIISDGKIGSLDVLQKNIATYIKETNAALDKYEKLLSKVEYPTDEVYNEFEKVYTEIKDADFRGSKISEDKRVTTGIGFEEAKRVAEKSLQNIDSYTKMVDKLVKDFKAKVDTVNKLASDVYKHFDNIEGINSAYLKNYINGLSGSLRYISFGFTVMSGALLKAGSVGADILLNSIDSDK